MFRARQKEAGVAQCSFALMAIFSEYLGFLSLLIGIISDTCLNFTLIDCFCVLSLTIPFLVRQFFVFCPQHDFISVFMVLTANVCVIVRHFLTAASVCCLIFGY